MALKPWREAVLPHPDVREGRYRKDEYMANLGAVDQGEAEAEYLNPVEFYRRTYVTGGIRDLLASVVGRLLGEGGDPVVQLKTNFGGGKTHSLLALYHLVRAPKKLAAAGLWPEGLRIAPDRLPPVRVAVLACTDLDPNVPRPHPELGGERVRTIWGEVAVRLLGAEGYDLVRDADKSGVAPGADTFATLLRRAGPALILMDEFVAYARNLYRPHTVPPGGSFEANMTFVHNLTEAVKRVVGAALVASLPVSKVELGGEGGETALEHVEQIFGRLEAVWRPVSVEESFEVVRRRIFSDVLDPAARDATCQAFFRFYQRHRDEFPVAASDRDYLERLAKAYPIHPEVFDRLYNDWSTLEGFQRTRGVLRLMAAVVHNLWTENDTSPLILPAVLPLDDEAVRSELTSPLPETENWNTVVETDIDGRQSAARRLDAEQSRFGQRLLARRIARTIFLQTAPGSADTGTDAIRGAEETAVRLGTLLPDDNLGTFHDALEQLQQMSTYLHRSSGQAGERGNRYWFDLRQHLGRLMESRARDILRVRAPVDEEIARRLKQQVEEAHRLRNGKSLPAVHVLQDEDLVQASADVPNNDSARLVVLRSGDGYREPGGQAVEAAKFILGHRGASDRTRKNMLLFLAPLAREVENLRLQTARYLAWQAIRADARQLNLDAYQTDEAERELRRQDEAVKKALAGTYAVLLDPREEIREERPVLTWQAVTFHATDDNVIRVALARAVGDELLRAEFAPQVLLPELERWFWREQPHVELATLWDAFTRYLYLPRLLDERVLRDAVVRGVAEGMFAYARERGAAPDAYGGVVFGREPELSTRGMTGVLVRKDAVPEKRPSSRPVEDAHGAGGPQPPGGEETPQPGAPRPVTAAKPSTREVHVLRAWRGREVNRLVQDVGTLQQEVLAELLATLGVEVEAELTVTVRGQDGIPQDRVRVAIENARALGVKIEVM